MNGNQKSNRANVSLISPIKAFRNGMKTASSNSHNLNAKVEGVPAPRGRLKVSAEVVLNGFSEKWFLVN